MAVKKFNKKPISVLLSILFAASGTAAYAQDGQGNSQGNNQEEETEVIVVEGFKRSLERAAEMKREASQIMDAISAEDIGKLPDNNVAEAMQRITGVQITRDETGQGSSFQVRGLSSNRVEVNGISRMSNDASGESRNSSFAGTPSALFKTIKVIKSPTADMIEGSLGATIRLETYEPLDFKKPKANLSAGGIYNDNADEVGHKLNALYTNKFDLDELGEIGFLVQATTNKTFTQTERMNVELFQVIQDGTNRDINQQSDFSVLPPNLNNFSRNILGDIGGLRDYGRNIFGSADLTGENGEKYQPFPEDYTILRPKNTDFEVRNIEDDNSGLNMNLQWAPNEDLRFTLQANLTESDRDISQTRFRFQHQKRDLRLNLDPSTYSINHYTRPNDQANYYIDDSGTPLSSDTISRGILTQGEFYAPDPKIGSRDNSSPALINSQRGITNTKQNIFAFDVEWTMTSFLTAEMNIAHSTYDSETESMYMNAQSVVAVPGTSGSNDASFMPSAYFDLNANTDLPSFGLDYSGVENAFAPFLIQQAEFDMDNPDHQAIVGDLRNTYTYQNIAAYGLNEISGNRQADEGAATSIELDFDVDVDEGIFTTVELGVRYSSQDRNRIRTERFSQAGVHYLKPSVRARSFLGYKAQNAAGQNDFQVGSFESISAYDNGRYKDYLNNLYASGHQMTEDLGFEEFSGDIPRRWPTPRSMDFSEMVEFANEFTGLQDRVCIDPEQSTESNYVTVDCQRDSRGFAYQDGQNTFLTNTESNTDDQGIETIIHSYSAQDNRVAWNPHLANDWYYKEATTAAYFKANFDGEVINIPFTGNFGVRVVNTDYTGEKVDAIGHTTNTSTIAEVEATLVRTSQTKDYTNVLPSANISFELKEDMYLRLAGSRGMRRPSPRAMLPGVRVNTAALGNVNQTLNFTVGNPDLQPIVSDQFDISWEYYLNQSTNISVAYFHKNIKNEIEQLREGVFLSDSGNSSDLIDRLPLEAQAVFNNIEFESDTGERSAIIRYSDNIGDSKVQGVEFGVQGTFDFLPGAWSGLGAQFNYTYTESERTKSLIESLTTIDEITGAKLPPLGLSEQSLNATLFYSRGGFDIHAAYNWRDGYLSSRNASDIDTALFTELDGGGYGQLSTSYPYFREAYGQLDLSTSYRIKKGPTIYLQAKNVLKSPREDKLSETGLLTKWNYSGMIVNFGVRWNINL